MIFWLQSGAVFFLKFWDTWNGINISCSQKECLIGIILNEAMPQNFVEAERNIFKTNKTLSGQTDGSFGKH